MDKVYTDHFDSYRTELEGKKIEIISVEKRFEHLYPPPGSTVIVELRPYGDLAIVSGEDYRNGLGLTYRVASSNLKGIAKFLKERKL